MDNFENRISSLKSRLEAKKNEKTRAEANLEMAEKQLQEVVGKIRDLGYEPNDLPDVIAQLEQSVTDNLAEAERILAETEMMKEAVAL
ncbi:MAG: hypothetical protein NC238_02875 [Dehalobacter sp.]|nr:hypothetical protein [Dehalobacter sp.]